MSLNVWPRRQKNLFFSILLILAWTLGRPWWKQILKWTSWAARGDREGAEHWNMLQINSENWPQVPQHLLNDCPWAEESVLSCPLGAHSHLLYLSNLSLITLFHITIILFLSKSYFSFSITIKDFTLGLNFSFAIDVSSHKVKWGFTIAASSWAAQVLHIKWIMMISLAYFRKQLPCIVDKNSCNLRSHGFCLNNRFFWAPHGNK